MLKKIARFFFAGVVILGVVVYFSYDYWLEQQLKHKLSEIISKDPNNLYTYSFTKLNIHLLEGSVELKGISIKPKANAFDSLARLASGMRYLIELNLAKIELENFAIKEFLLTGKMFIRSLAIEQPEFKYYFHPRKKNTGKGIQLGSVFSDKFSEANIELLSVEGATIEVVDYTKSGPAFTIENLTIALTKAHIDSATLKQFTPITYTDIRAKAAGVRIAAMKDFEINSDSLIFKIEKQTIEVNNFQVNPKYSQKNFARAFPVQKQWFALQLDKLVLSRINFPEFVHSGKVEVGHVAVIAPNIGLYKDKSKPMPPFRKKKLLASAIRAIPWSISVDSVSLTNGNITINETSALTGRDSHLTITALNALVLNFTNDSMHTSANHFLTLTASARVMSEALTQLTMRFDLTSEADKFTATGHAGKVKASVFNPVLEPLMGVKVTNGTIYNLDFNFSAMDTLSTGTLDIEYEALKLQIMRTDTTAKKKSNKKGFVSLAANTVVKTNNLKTQGNYLQGIINTERVLEKDVWPFLWHSIQSGLVSTLVPITNNKAAKQQQKGVRQKLREKKKKGKR